MKNVLLVRWLLLSLLVIVSYALGRWHGMRFAIESAAATPSEAHEEPAPAKLSREQLLLGELRFLAEAARHMPDPDARTYAFFEKLRSTDIPAVSAYIETLPAGNERDLFRALLVRSWAEMDGPAALAYTATFAALSKRDDARLAVFDHWARQDGAAAMLAIQQQSGEAMRFPEMTAVLSGAAVTDPRAALDLLQLTPPSFRDGPAALNAARLIASAAFGTGKREEMVALIAGLRPSPTRNALAEGLVQDWGIHYPDETRAWIESTWPVGDEQDGLLLSMFTAFARHAPAQAAEWAIRFPDPAKGAAFVATAVGDWVRYDVADAETWLNEQDIGVPLDGAAYAIASHHINAGHMQQAFAWIQRIARDDARGELLGTLGRIWSQQRPEEFKKFIAETSLNRVELDLLLSKAQR